MVLREADLPPSVPLSRAVLGNLSSLTHISCAAAQTYEPAASASGSVALTRDYITRIHTINANTTANRARRRTYLLNLRGIHLQPLPRHMNLQKTLAVDQLLMHFLIDATSSAVTGRERARMSGLLERALGRGAESAYAVIAQRRNEHGPEAGFTDVAWLRRLLRTPLVEQRGRRLRAFTSKPPERTELEQATAEGWVLAISRERALAELPHAMYEAEELSRTARRLGTHVGGHDLEQLSKVWPLAAIADPMLGGAAASLWLAPLDGDEYRAERAALSAWLQRHGSWDRTARDLDLHRNTVRRLVASAGERLGRDLDDPVERARLLLAFTAIDPEN